MADECIAFKEPADRITVRAATALTGKRTVILTGNETADLLPSCGRGAAAADHVLGIAEQTAAAGTNVGCITVESGHIVPVTSGAALAVGDKVVSDATGRAVAAAPAAGTSIECFGTVMTAVGAADLDAKIKLGRCVATTAP